MEAKQEHETLMETLRIAEEGRLVWAEAVRVRTETSSMITLHIQRMNYHHAIMKRITLLYGIIVAIQILAQVILKIEKMP